MAGERVPLLRTDDLAGGIWIPGDGKANPTDLAQSLAKGARTRGAKIVENVKVTAVHRRDRHVTGLDWISDGEHGRIDCEIVVNCAGQWARELGALAGVDVPLQSAEHFYIVTEPIAGVTPTMPVMRDPDGYIYFKEEVGGVSWAASSRWPSRGASSESRIDSNSSCWPRTGTSSKC